MRWQLVIAAALWVLIPDLATAGDNWPKFRGPDGTGVAENPRLPDRWSATENIAWKTDIPGRGWSCPVVWGDRVFLTTAVNTGATPDAKKGLYFGGEQSKPPETEHHWKVYCLNLKTGSVEWEQTAHKGVPATTLHIKNTYATETPVTDGERIYFLFGNVGVFCYDLGGKLIWSKPIEPRRMQAGWGTAASPALHGDRLFLVNDNQEQSYLQALDTRTGDEIWRVERDEKSNWATPFVWQNDQRTELVTPGTKKMRSYDLDGKLLWEFAGASAITIATPYAADGLLYLSSGYVLDPKRPMYAVRPGASGDITLASGQNSNEFIAWCDRTAAPYNPSTLVYKDRLYVLYDMGLFACFDARTGQEIYGGGNKKMRIPNGRACTASPWAYNGKVFCLNEYAETFVIEAGADEFKLLHTNSLGDEETALATPAIVGDRLLIRTAQRVYCVRQPE
ncbi:MAG TPA: PQQ-binding-like beta-propeller repeat protein [Planctomycetaceae bacterium]|nr:PQQ-binding-like beta-propeller repeat protein [Planctomycetaceae bacterium]